MAERARRVDSDDAHGLAALAQHPDQRANQSALTGAGGPGDADYVRAAAFREEHAQGLTPLAATVLDRGEDARERPPVAFEEALDAVGNHLRSRCAALRAVFGDPGHDVMGGGAGTEDAVEADLL